MHSTCKAIPVVVACVCNRDRTAFDQLEVPSSLWGYPRRLAGHAQYGLPLEPLPLACTTSRQPYVRRGFIFQVTGTARPDTHAKTVERGLGSQQLG